MKALFIAPMVLLASCGGSGTPDIQVTDAWARATVAGQSGTAAYATIVNRGSGDDRLLGVSVASPIEASLHETTTSGGVSSMRPLENGLDIPAGATIALMDIDPVRLERARAVVQAIVDAHGGSIRADVNREAGRGTIFTVRLPVRSPARLPAAVVAGGEPPPFVVHSRGSR